MFLGKYYHTLEAKGRITLPSEFRAQTTNWIITRGLDGGLFLIPAESFNVELQKLEARSFTTKAHRDFIRLMTNEAKALVPDQNGRVQLPEYLIAFAKLDKDVVVVGSLSRVEIWDRESYHQYIDQLEPQAEAIAELLAQTASQPDERAHD